MTYLKNPRSWVLASFLVGFILTFSGWMLWENQSAQTIWYNRGLIAYNTGNYDLAVENFDKSFAAYQSALSEKKSPLVAGPSVEQAALAQFHKFKALLKMKNGKLAVISIKESLKVSTELNLSRFQLDEAELKRIREQRIIAQTDLEILFKQQQQMAEQEGKGKGNKPGKPGEDKQAQDPSKGSNPGKTNRDAL